MAELWRLRGISLTNRHHQRVECNKDTPQLPNRSQMAGLVRQTNPEELMSTLFKPLAAAAAIFALALSVAPVQAQQQGSLGVELNKFEEIEGGGCRTFFLFRNKTGQSFEGFEMSLAILDGNAVIDRLLSIDAAPLPVARTTLKLFEIPEISCTNISEILLHDMTSCKPQNAEETDCFAIIELSSKTSAPLVK